MASPTMTDVHQNVPLSNISQAYRNQGYIANEILPEVEVQHQADDFYVWTKEYWFRNYVERRAPGDTYPEGDTKLTTDSYSCRLYHLAKGVNDEDRANQDEAVDLDTSAAEWLADQFQLNRELLVSAATFAGGIWAAIDDVLAGVDRWDDYDASNPLTQMKAMNEAIQIITGMTMNTLVMGVQVFNTLQEHPILLDKYKYTTAGMLDHEQCRAALGIDKLIVGNAIQNTAAEGAFTGAYIWGKSILGLYVPPSPGLLVPSPGYTFRWANVAPGFPTAITTIRQDDRDRDLHRGKTAFVEKITGTDLGAYYGTVIS